MSVFKYDDRNLGGRKIIHKHLYNHWDALKNIKPTINTHIAPRVMVKSKRKQSKISERILLNS